MNKIAQQSFLQATKGKIIIGFFLACLALFLAWGVNKVTLQKMLSLGIGDTFLVYWNLAQEYKFLGDMEASRRHEVVYLQNIDVALLEALDSNLD